MAWRWLLAFAPLFMVYPMLYLCSARVIHNLRSDYSYGVYLYAFPLAQVVGTTFPRLQPLQLALAAYIPTLLLGALSWHFVERPFLKLKQGFRMPTSMRDRPAA
jgi:peptidoglycan/LPS O-acetylase OafA/YrhL